MTAPAPDDRAGAGARRPDRQAIVAERLAPKDPHRAGCVVFVRETVP